MAISSLLVFQKHILLDLEFSMKLMETDGTAVKCCYPHVPLLLFIEDPLEWLL